MSIFRDTFKPSVQSQLKTRQTSIASRTSDAIQYYNARNAWVRMTSAVDVANDKGDLASKYILQGGTLNQGNLRAGVGTGNEAYSLNPPGGGSNNNRLGIRPMPGITGIDVQSKGSYGSLRTVTVNFIVWDLRQLEDLELLYMRPGYTALIEWGWAPYLDNSGNLSNSIPFYDIINNTPSQEQIYLDLFKRASETGNYEAMYGKIQNYSWKARVDGGYDCTTTIISIGEVIDSLKVNYAPFHIPEVEKTGIIASRISGLPEVQNEISGSYSQNIIAGLCSELYAIANKRADDNQIYKIVDGSDTFTFYKVPLKISNNEATKTVITKSGNQIYITLESFVAIMNKYVLLQVPGGMPYVKLSVNSSTITSPEGKSEPLLCLGDKIQISTNPSVCLIANEAWLSPEGNLGIKDAKPNDTLNSFINASKAEGKGYFYNGDWQELQYGVIGNIFINLDYIYSIVTDDNTASQDKKEKNDISLYTFTKTLMAGINTAIGNVANFDVHVDPTDGNIARIIDVNYVDVATRDEAYKNAFTFEMQKTGPDTGAIIRNYSFESQIFPEQSATIAIASQVKSGALGSGDNTLVDFYRNLTDRIIPKKEAPLEKAGATKAAAAEKDNLLQTYQTNLETLMSYINELDSDSFLGFQISDGTFDVSKASSYSNALKDIINYFKSYEKNNNNNRGIIPTKLSFEIDGIGGIVIGNMFRIPDEILPRGYRSPTSNSPDNPGPAKIAFLVLKLDHSVQNNDWVTKIDSQFVILDDPKGRGITNEERKAITRRVTSGNTGGGQGQGQSVTPSDKPRKTGKCDKSVQIINASNAPGLKIEGNTPWNKIKTQFPVVNGPIPVQSVGTPYDSGTNFAYKMKARRVEKAPNRKINYIVLHYTVSSATDPLIHYRNTWEGGVASSDFTIARNGRIAGFKDFRNYRCWHYGDATWGGDMNRESIGFEIESYGPVYYCQTTGKFLNFAYNQEMAQSEVAFTRVYRGWNMWHALSEVQVSAIANLILALYNSGAISDKAKFVSGMKATGRENILFPDTGLRTKPAPGILTHGSGRDPSGKIDLFPQDNLRQMLDDLPNLVATYTQTSIKWVP